MVIVDLDDAFDGNDRWEMLSELRAEIPQFCVTLFTIGGRCTVKWLDRMLDTDWVDLVPHGWTHTSNYECSRWDAAAMHKCLDHYEAMGFRTKGFKAPGWQISDACFSVLLERGYWVADQDYNNERRPATLPVYLLDSASKIHGHVNHVGGFNPNELEYIAPMIRASKKEKFGFVKDAVWRPSIS